MSDALLDLTVAVDSCVTAAIESVAAELDLLRVSPHPKIAWHRVRSALRVVWRCCADRSLPDCDGFPRVATPADEVDLSALNLLFAAPPRVIA